MIRQTQRAHPCSWSFTHRCCGIEYRGDYRDITRAPADMAGEHVADLPLVRPGRLSQKMRHGTQYARSAEPTLQGMMFRERALQLVEGAGRSQSLDRHDVGTVCLRGVL